jgi:hypothetical protein
VFEWLRHTHGQHPPSCLGVTLSEVAYQRPPPNEPNPATSPTTRLSISINRRPLCPLLPHRQSSHHPTQHNPSPPKKNNPPPNPQDFSININCRHLWNCQATRQSYDALLRYPQVRTRVRAGVYTEAWGAVGTSMVCVGTCVRVDVYTEAWGAVGTGMVCEGTCVRAGVRT